MKSNTCYNVGIVFQMMSTPKKESRRRGFLHQILRISNSKNVQCRPRRTLALKPTRYVCRPSGSIAVIIARNPCRAWTFAHSCHFQADCSAFRLSLLHFTTRFTARGPKHVDLRRSGQEEACSQIDNGWLAGFCAWL